MPEIFEDILNVVTENQDTLTKIQDEIRTLKNEVAKILLQLNILETHTRETTIRERRKIPIPPPRPLELIGLEEEITKEIKRPFKTDEEFFENIMKIELKKLKQREASIKGKEKIEEPKKDSKDE